MCSRALPVDYKGARMPDKNIVDKVKEAIQSSKQRKFVEGIDLAINLKDIDLSVPKNRIEEEIILPKGRGKSIKIAVFGSGELAMKAKNVADLVIQPEDLEELARNKKKARMMAKEYTFFIAETPMMPAIGKRLGMVLAPRGKMPRPIPPTADPIPIINNLRSTVKLRSRDRHTFHLTVGTKDMQVEEIAENVEAVLKRLIDKLERGKLNVASIYIKTTMGKAVRLM